MKANWRCQCPRCSGARDAFIGIGPALVAMLLVLAFYKMGLL